MDIYEILTGFISLLVIVVGFFLKVLHARLKQAEKDIVSDHDRIIELKSENKEIKLFQNSGFLHMEKLFDEKFKSIDRTLEHMNNNLKTSHDFFALVINEQKDKNNNNIRFQN